MLSNRQQEVLRYIESYIDEYRMPPSVRQIQNHLGVKSIAMVQAILAKLEQYCFIEKTDESQRNIRLITPPEEEYSLPLVGRIAAGAPIEAVETPQSVAVAKLLTGEDRFLLEVKGDSMMGDNICDGDWIICEKRSTARDGNIVVALIDQTSATLKRFYLKENRVFLEPSNKAYPMQEYSSDRVTIQGIYLGLIRFTPFR